MVRVRRVYVVLVALAVLGLTACGGGQSTLSPASPQQDEISKLFWIMLAPVTTVSIPLIVAGIALMTFLTASIVRSYDLLLRVPAEVSAEAGARQPAHSH